MNKGIGLLILGGLAVIGGAVFAALLIKNKFAGSRNIDFDDFDDFDFTDEEGFEQLLNEGNIAEITEEEED
ncbi:MAG: hypothetical protein LBC86_01205 [Oscillospiraceae bacterium]|jgi:hypothetical protein|nr:hypothetical protein [Oscillospiraceae bacterium]